MLSVFFKWPIDCHWDSLTIGQDQSSSASVAPRTHPNLQMKPWYRFNLTFDPASKTRELQSITYMRGIWAVSLWCRSNLLKLISPFACLIDIHVWVPMRNLAHVWRDRPTCPKLRLHYSIICLKGPLLLRQMLAHSTKDINSKQTVSVYHVSCYVSVCRQIDACFLYNCWHHHISHIISYHPCHLPGTLYLTGPPVVLLQNCNIQ